MKDQLRKLAVRLREEAEKESKRDNVKCAQIVQAAVGLEVLRQKIGG